MAIVYIKLGVSIHGLKIEENADAAMDFLTGWVRESVVAALSGNQKDLFNFRNEYLSDVAVEIEEHAGHADETIDIGEGTDY